MGSKTTTSQIGLHPDQAERLRRHPGDGAAIIKTAIIRYKRGEILLQNARKKEKAHFVYIHIRKRPPFSDSEIRRILDAHFAAPMFAKEIAAADREIAEMLRQYSGVEFIEEKPQE